MERDMHSNIGEEESRSKGLGRSDSPIKARINREAIYDSNLMGKEIEALSEHTSLVTEAMGTIAVSSPKERDRWLFLEEKDEILRDLLVHLRSEASEMIYNRSGDYTWSQLSRMEGFVLGTSLLFQRTVQEKITIARKNSFEDKYIPLAELLELGIVPELSISLGGVTLQDFQKFNPKTTSPAPYYKYLLEGRLMEKDTAQHAFEENQDYPKSMYPNLTKHAISNLSTRLFAVINLTPETIPTDTKEPILQESGKLVVRLLEGVQNVRRKTNQVILDPTSRDFPELSTFVAQYLERDDKEARVISLYVMNLDNRQRIIEAYRKARKYEIEDNEGEFYMIFGDSIGEYIEEAAPFMNILTSDDIASIVDGEKIEHDEGKSEPTFEQLGKTVNDILNRTSNREFDINPSDIDWLQLHVPQEAQIHFDANRPRKFTIIVNFNNELGESTEVECTVDTSRNFMDWNHPEDPMLLPEGSDLRLFRRSLLFAAQSMLDNVYQKTQEEYQSRQASQTVSSPIETRRLKRERVQDPVYELRKTARAQQQEQSAGTNILFEVLSSKEKIKNRIILSSEEDFEDMTRSLSYVDREIIRKSIEEYNEKATGAKFSRKKGSGAEGTLVYGLSIGCTVPKGARVLLREAESGDGVRNFEIIDIRYRKDIYSKHNL